MFNLFGIRIKLGKPLQVVVNALLAGKSLEEAVADYGESIVINNIGKEKIIGEIDKALELLRNDKIASLEHKLETLKANIQGGTL